VTSAPSSEYAVSFDRWFLVPYDWVLARYNVLYHATDVVKRNDVLWVLSHNGTTTKCATPTAVAQAGDDDKYTYELTLRGVEVVNYRTLMGGSAVEDCRRRQGCCEHNSIQYNK
jgi:hypothetical protein